MIRVKVYTASTEEPVSILEVKQWLRLEEDEVTDDPVVEALIATARGRIEERHKRAYMRQTFDAYLDACEIPYHGDPIEMPRSPLVSVSSIRYFGSSEISDTGGTSVSTTGFYVDTAREPGRIVPAQGVAYPTPTRDTNALIVRFEAGYSTSSTGIPDQAKTEIKQLVAKLYEHRGDEPALAAVLMDYDQQPSDFDLPEWG